MITIEYSDDALKQLTKMDKHDAKIIKDYMNDEIAVLSSPYQKGKSLTGNLSGLWRYRVADYRIICEIKNDKLNVLVLQIGHRREIYKKK